MSIFQLIGYLKRTWLGSKRLIAALLILQAVAMMPIAAQEFDEGSIAEPTQLSIAATAESAKIAVVKSFAPLTSENSIAEASIIEVVTLEGKHYRGVRILFKNASQADDIYFNQSQASQLEGEFAGMKRWYENNQTCEANSQCVHGVARCRPSQGTRQAFCPGFYTSRAGEQGVIVSTPHHSFYFPSITPSMFSNMIDAAIDELNQH